MQVPRLAFVIGGDSHGGPVGAHLCVRPCTKAACAQRADTSVGPYRGSKVVLCFGGVADGGFVQRAGHAPPLQSNHADPHTRKERHMALRLVCIATFTKTNMPTPGPGPQARCGKGVWSPEDQGDRCRVPRSFGPSGAGGEKVELLKRIQQDDHPTKGEHAAAAATPHPSAAPTPSPLGEGKGEHAAAAATPHPSAAPTPSPPRGRQ